MNDVQIGVLIAAAALVAAVVAIPPTRRQGRAAGVEAKVAEFKKRFIELRQSQIELSDGVLRASDPSWRAHDVPMLTRAGWIFDHPVPIDEIEVEFVSESASDDSRTNVTVPAHALLEGLDLSGPITYSDAVTRIAGMSHFTNGVIYRPLQLTANDLGVHLTFEASKYFGYLDTSEVLAYKEMQSPGSNRYRKHLRDPFNLSNRVASLGILTLTILRNGNRPATFVLHKRTAKVVLGSDLYHVIPAGEFTPSDLSQTAIREDLSLWRNICREYAEELLGDLDAQGDGGRKIDYANSEPYQSLNMALRNGQLDVYALGFGLDPLSWKPELLTVAIFDAGTFDKIFGTKIVGNYEGKVILGEQFNPMTLRNYVEGGSTRPGAKACLRLAWRHRSALGLT
jgi:hypothetical protein